MSTWRGFTCKKRNLDFTPTQGNEYHNLPLRGWLYQRPSLSKLSPIMLDDIRSVEPILMLVLPHLSPISKSRAYFGYVRPKNTRDLVCPKSAFPLQHVISCLLHVRLFKTNANNAPFTAPIALTHRTLIVLSNGTNALPLHSTFSAAYAHLPSRFLFGQPTNFPHRI